MKINYYAAWSLYCVLNSYIKKHGSWFNWKKMSLLYKKSHKIFSQFIEICLLNMLSHWIKKHKNKIFILLCLHLQESYSNKDFGHKFTLQLNPSVHNIFFMYKWKHTDATAGSVSVLLDFTLSRHQTSERAGDARQILDWTEFCNRELA